MRFETERLILRPWLESDAESLYEYAKDPQVGPIAGWPVHTSVENSLEIIKGVLSAEGTYAVCLKEDNRAIGSVGLIPPAQSHTKAKENEIEIGYWIGVPFWGQGLIPEAVKRLQQHVFEDLGFDAIWCGYYDGNEKSRRCQEKCGFIFHHTEENKPCQLMGDIRTEHFTRLTREQWEEQSEERQGSLVLYIHGKGGNAGEAEHYKELFPQADVYGFDYQSEYPWEAKVEFVSELEKWKQQYDKIILIANSIGAFFSIQSGIDDYIDQAYFISPIVNMEKLICDMMGWAGVTEQELEEKQIIPVEFGDDLSWEYLQYVRKNPIKWDTPTRILYGSEDMLQSLDTIYAFAENGNAQKGNSENRSRHQVEDAHEPDTTTMKYPVTVMEGGEHWFHTEEQMEFLDQWILDREQSREN